MSKLMPVLLALCVIALAAGEGTGPAAIDRSPAAENVTTGPAEQALPEHKDLGPPTGIDTRPPVEPPTDAIWGTQQRLTTYTGSDYIGLPNQKGIATDGEYVYCVWETYNSYNIECVVSTDHGQSWGSIVTVNSGTYSAYYPSVCVDNNGYVHVVWYRTGTGYYGIWYSRSTDNGVTWSAEQRIYSSSSYNYYPMIACQPGTDHLGLVWYGYSQTGSSPYRIHFQESTDGGTSWINHVEVSDYTGNYQYYPSVDLHSDGTVHVFWQGYTSGMSRYGVMYRQRNSGGTWLSVENATPSDFSSYYCYNTFGTVDASGNAHAVWEAYKSGISYYQIWHMERDQGTGTWGDYEQVSVNLSYYNYDPQIAVGPSGALHVTWQGKLSGSGYPRVPMYRAKLGASWLSAQEIPSGITSSYPYRTPHVDVDANERVHVMWTAYQPQNNTDVLYNRGDPPPANDVGVTGISFGSVYTLVSGMDLDVTITIQNFSFAAVTADIPVSYTVDGGTPVTETYTGGLAAGGSYDYTFSTQWSPTVVGKHIFDAATALTIDPNPANDGYQIPELSIWPERTLVGNCFNRAVWPPPGWSTAIVNGSMDWTASATGYYPGNTPLEGDYMAHYNCYSAYPPAGSRLITHTFQVTAATPVLVDFWHYECSGVNAGDALALDYSTDGGSNWTTSGTWMNYNAANPGWVNYSIQTGTVPAGTDILVAFRSISGWYIDTNVDSIRIFEPPDYDVYVTEIVHPGGSYPGDETFYPEIVIKNGGKQAVANVPVHVEIYDGATKLYDQTRIYNAVLDPGTIGTVEFDVGFYTGFEDKTFDYAAITEMVGDEVPENDTTVGTFSVSTMFWVRLTDDPAATPERCGGAVDGDGNFYRLGGNITTRCDRYIRATGVWEQIGDHPMSGGTGNLSHPVYVPSEDKIYAFGGYSGSYYGNVAELDPATGTWTVGDALPLAECGIPAALLGDLIYVGIGNNGFYSYDWDTGTFTSLTTFPGQSFRYGAMCAHDGKIYVCGGWYSSPHTEFWVYDPVATTWTQLDNFFYGIEYAGMCSFQGKIWIWGGANGWTQGYDDVCTWDETNGWQYAGKTLSDHGNAATAFAEPDMFYACAGLYAGNPAFFETTVVLKPSDAGVVSIDAPTGYIATNTIVTPVATFKNYHGTTAASFEAHYYLFDPYDVERYHNTINWTLNPGDQIQLSFLPFNVGTDEGRWRSMCSTYTEMGDINHANDALSQGFYVSDNPFDPGWVEVTRMPAGAKPVKDGGWLAKDPSDELIYATRGNKTGDFFRYYPEKDSWAQLMSMPEGIEGKPPRKGSRGACDGMGNLYATKGNNTFGFWRYDIGADSWYQMPNVPEGPRRKKVKGGTDMVYMVKEDTGYVYLMKGYKTEFYRYNTVSGLWETMPDMPYVLKEKWDKGSWLAWDGNLDGFIYAHQAKYYDRAKYEHHMFRYYVEQDSWDPTPLHGMPLYGLHGGRIRKKKSKDGGAGAYLNDEIWALKGGNTQQFFKYDVGQDTWVEMDTMPVYGSTGRKKRVKHGADLVHWSGPVFFALKGNKTDEMWRYVMSFGALLGSRPERSGTMGERTMPLGITCAPNPLARGFATVRYSLPNAGPAQLSVFDVTGRTVSRHTIAATRTGAVRLDLRDLSAGIYLVKLESDSQTFTQKLVVQH